MMPDYLRAFSPNKYFLFRKRAHISYPWISIDLTNSCVATLNMIYFTCGGIVGNTLVGYAFDYGGSNMVYLGGAACMGGTLLLFNSEQAVFDRDLAKEPID